MPSRKHKLAARQMMRKLSRGERIYNALNHHRGMSYLLMLLGNGKSEGMTLSLINCTSPDTYWGIGRWSATRLSTNPADYAWETREVNSARTKPQFVELVQAGLIDLNCDGEVEYL